MGLSEETLKKRFHNNYDILDSGCWEWNKSRLIAGYGQFNVLNERLAHRVSYILYNGHFVGNDVVILHTCDNPPCVNPEHLILGTQKDNIIDCVNKERHFSPNKCKSHCKRGHEFTESNTYLHVKSNKRKCRECSKLKMRKRRENKL